MREILRFGLVFSALAALTVSVAGAQQDKGSPAKALPKQAVKDAGVTDLGVFRYLFGALQMQVVKDEGDKDYGDKNNKDDGDKNNKDDGQKNDKDDGQKNNKDDGDKNNKDDGDKKTEPSKTASPATDPKRAELEKQIEALRKQIEELQKQLKK